MKLQENSPLITEMEINASPSEDHGIEALTSTDREIYSVGISTGGIAEMRMALYNPDRHITATTIDVEGLEFARGLIEQNKLNGQIDARLEDVTEPLPYADDRFDYIYARLILHYLGKKDLVKALDALYRVARPGGRLFAVVRSTESHDMKRPGAITDLKTMFTEYTFTNPTNGHLRTVRRYFHSKDSIRGYVQDAGFSIDYVKDYQEHIYVDFMRKYLASEPDEVIELLATKPII